MLFFLSLSLLLQGSSWSPRLTDLHHEAGWQVSRITLLLPVSVDILGFSIPSAKYFLSALIDMVFHTASSLLKPCVKASAVFDKVLFSLLSTFISRWGTCFLFMIVWSCPENWIACPSHSQAKSSMCSRFIVRNDCLAWHFAGITANRYCVVWVVSFSPVYVILKFRFWLMCTAMPSQCLAAIALFSDVTRRSLKKLPSLWLNRMCFLKWKRSAHMIKTGQCAVCAVCFFLSMPCYWTNALTQPCHALLSANESHWDQHCVCVRVFRRLCGWPAWFATRVQALLSISTAKMAGFTSLSSIHVFR